MERPRPCSSSSAFSLSSSTTARRTVQTLIGSYVAFRTSTRPPIAVVGDVLGPRRWCSEGGTDPAGSGGTVLSILAPQCSGGAVISLRCGTAARQSGGGACGSVGAEHAHLLAQPPQPVDGLGHRRVRRASRAGRRRTCSCPRRSRRGRDSICVRLISLRANTSRQRTSQPGRSAPGPPEDERGLPLPGRPRAGAVAARALAAGSRRWPWPATRSAFRCRRGPRRPAAGPCRRRSSRPAASRSPRARAALALRPTTTRTASAVELAGMMRAWASSARRKRRHCPGTCGWVIPSRSAPARAARRRSASA